MLCFWLGAPGGMIMMSLTLDTAELNQNRPAGIVADFLDVR